MSGREELVPLEECCSNYNSIYVVTITGSVSGEIKELSKFGPEISHRTVFKAKVDEVLYTSNSRIVTLPSESWRLILPESEKNLVKKIKSKLRNYPVINDDIYIMDSDNIENALLYHRKGLRKIVIYRRCTDSAKSIGTGERYFFVSSGGVDMKNMVFNGSIGSGIFPYTKEIEMRISRLINSWK